MNDNAFDIAVIEFSSRLRTYFRRRVRDCSAAEDLAQETLLKAYRSRGALRDQTRVEAWLYRIAHVTMVDYYRRKPLVAGIPDEVVAEEPGDQDGVMGVVVCSARCYLETLPRTYRDPVHLADYEGLPHIEVARKLGISLTAVKSRIRRGKLMVRSLMEARCQFEYDVLGNIIGYQVRSSSACSART